MLVGKDTEELFADMGATWDYLMSDARLRWYARHLLFSAPS
jgi:L-fuconate dehydratase